MELMGSATATTRTRAIANKDGLVSVARLNDPSVRTHVATTEYAWMAFARARLLT